MADFQRGRRGMQTPARVQGVRVSQEIPNASEFALRAPDLSAGNQQVRNFANTVEMLLPGTGVQYLPRSGWLGALESTFDETGRQRQAVVPSLVKGIKSYQNALKPASSGGSGGDIKTFAEMAAEGSASDKVLKALETQQNAKLRSEVGEKPGKGILDQLGDVAKGVGELTLKGGLKALDYLNRPLQAIEVPLKNRIEEYNQTGDLGDLFSPTDILSESAKGFTGKERTTGGEIFREAGAPGIIAAPFGLALDILGDPVTYASFGATAIGKPMGKIAAEAGLSIAERELMEQGLENVTRITRKGAARGVKRLSEAELDSAIAGTVAKRMESFAANEAPKIESKLLSAGGDTIEAASKAKEATELAGKELRDRLLTAAEPLTKNKLQFRLGFLGKGPDVLAKSATGEAIAEGLWKPLARSNELLQKTGAGKAARNLFNHEWNFPGRLQAIRNRALGVRTQIHDQFVENVLAQYKHVPKEMQEQIFHAVEGDYSLAGHFAPDGTSLEQLRQEAKQFFREKGQEAVDFGLLKDGELVKDGYAYHAYKPGKWRDAAKDFRYHRASTLSNPNIDKVPAELTAKFASQAEHLRPKQNILDSMIEYSARHERDIARKATVEDAVLTYGHLGPSLGAPSKLGLEAVPLNDLTPDLLEDAYRSALAANPGIDPEDVVPHVWYMPTKMNEGLKKFYDITKLQNIDELNKFWRGIDSINRWFKFSRTVPRPTYHINNMMTDAFIGYLDNIPFDEYRQVIERYGQGKAGQVVSDVTLAPGHEIPFGRVVDEFRNNAAGANFFHTDVGVGHAIPDRPGEALKALAGKGRKFSERREDFGRFTHFQGALKQEYAAEIAGKGIKAGTPEAERALQKAIKRAADRVSYHKIDFAALTPFEIKYAKRAIPFYTFMRKAFPVMMASLARTPGRMQMPVKVLNEISTLLGTDTQNNHLDPRRIPDYLRDTGTFLQLTGGEEPFFLNLTSALPTASLLNPLGLEEVSQKSVAKALLGKANPLYNMPYEIMTGKKLYTGAEVGGVLDWTKSTLNPIDWLTGDTLNPAEWVPRELGNAPTAALKALNVSRLPLDRQAATIKNDTRQYTAVNSILNDRLTQNGMEIRSSNLKQGQRWRLLDRRNGRILGTFTSPAEAQMAADELIRNGGV